MLCEFDLSIELQSTCINPRCDGEHRAGCPGSSVPRVRRRPGAVDPVTQLLRTDAQTSGGLMRDVPPQQASAVVAALRDQGESNGLTDQAGCLRGRCGAGTHNRSAQVRWLRGQGQRQGRPPRAARRSLLGQRRWRAGGPLGDTRGAAGRPRAIRAAVLGMQAEGPDAVEAEVAAALTAGDRYSRQTQLFGPPSPATASSWGAACIGRVAAPTGNADPLP